MPQDDWKTQLAGLQIPAEPSAWPPAPLAVLLGLAALALIIGALWAIRRRWQRGAWRRAALTELQRLGPEPDPLQLSRLLRRVTRARFSAREAALGDAAFAQFLLSSGGHNFPADIAEDLASCAHRANPALDQRHSQAVALWIRTC